jgi:hypothetical protein
MGIGHDWALMQRIFGTANHGGGCSIGMIGGALSAEPAYGEKANRTRSGFIKTEQITLIKFAKKRMWLNSIADMPTDLHQEDVEAQNRAMS